MNTARYFNIFCALVFIIVGIMGIMYPDGAAKFYGLSLNTLDGKTEIRALSGFGLSVGVVLGYFAFKLDNQKPILLSLGIILLGYIIPRLIGLYLDGINQPIIHKELLFEVVILIITLFFYCRVKDKSV